jgi:lysophospholipase L1-like esterase
MARNTELIEDQIGHLPRTVVVGDSLVQQHILQGLNWTEQMTMKYNQVGSTGKVYNVGISGSTFYRAMNLQQYGQGTVTQQQAVINYKPDYVVVTLGFNDLVNPDATDNRTLAQVKQDATDFVISLRAALPGVVIIWAAVKPYDMSQSVTNLLNKMVIPFKMNLPTVGIYANCYSPEMLENNISSQVQTYMENWKNFYDTMQGLFDNTIPVDYFRIARLGCLSNDGLHPDNMGANLYCGYIMKGLTSLYPATYLSIVGAYPTWTDPDVLFNEVFNVSGNGYITKTTWLKDQKQLFDWYYQGAFCPDLWHMPYNGSVLTPTDIKANDTGNYYFASVRGAKPFEKVYVSINNGNWVDTNVTTNEWGDSLAIGAPSSVSGLFFSGNNFIRHKIGNCIYPMRIMTLIP